MKDYKHSDDGDLDFSSGDLVQVESTAQHQSDIITSFKGSLKAFPTVGVGAVDYIADNNQEGLLRSIRKQFVTDGQKVKSIEMIDGFINVDAGYGD